MKFLIFVSSILCLLHFSQSNKLKLNANSMDDKPYTIAKSKKCYHKSLPKPQFLNPILPNHRMKSHRVTKSVYTKKTAVFENMRIHFDYTYTLPYEETILKEFVIPPVKKYFESTLKVRRFPGKIFLPKKGGVVCSGVDTPDYLTNRGVEADIIIFITTVRGMKKYAHDWESKNKTTTNDTVLFRNYTYDYLDHYFKNITNHSHTKEEQSWEVNDGPEGVVGWSYSCIQDMYTLRPLVGVMQYVAEIEPIERSIQEAIWTTLHEFTHIFAFDSALFYHFVDEDYNKLGITEILSLKTRWFGWNEWLDSVKNIVDSSDFEEFKKVANAAIKNILKKNKPEEGNRINTKQEKWNEGNKSNSRVKSNYRGMTNEVALNLSENNNTCRNDTLNGVDTNNTNNTSNTGETEDTWTEEDNITSTDEPESISLPLWDEYIDVNLPPNFSIDMIGSFISNFGEYTKGFIKTKKVMSKAKKYFDCPDLQGVELEHWGGLGSAFSHWSKRVLNTEFMIADSYGENYISAITWALLEDSGWYKVNYANAHNIKWGKKKGCSFLNTKCITERNSTHFLKKADIEYQTQYKEEFCLNFNEEKCSPGRIFRGICALKQYDNETTPIPKEYNYFPNNKEYPNGNIGGLDFFGDFCPYSIEFRDKQSYLPNGSCVNGALLRDEKDEKICENCRCFHSSWVSEEKTSQGTLRDDEELKAVCYEMQCKEKVNSEKKYLAIIVGNTEIECPFNGGVLTLEGYSGQIECPKYEALCSVDEIKETNKSYGWFKLIPKHLMNMWYDFLVNSIYGDVKN